MTFKDSILKGDSCQTNREMVVMMSVVPSLTDVGLCYMFFPLIKSKMTQK